MIETIKNTLNENQNITPEVAENLLGIVELFNSKFSDIDLNNLNERLKTLIIRRESKYLLKLPCQYNPHNNEITINYGEFEKNDSTHWLTRSLVSMVTADENRFGFDDEQGSLQALNEGYTEMITNYLVGTEEDNFYTAEVIIANLISRAITEDTMYNAYFNNDSKTILDALITASNNILDEEKRETMLADFNNDLTSRSNHLPTNEFEKQGMIIDYFPQVAKNHPEDFCFSPEYYPEWTREHLDVENLEMVAEKFTAALTNKQEPKVNVLIEEELQPTLIEEEIKPAVIEEELAPARAVK